MGCGGCADRAARAQVVDELHLTATEIEQTCRMYEKYLCNMAVLRWQREKMSARLAAAYQQPDSDWQAQVTHEQTQLQGFLSASASIETLYTWLRKETELYCDLLTSVCLEVRRAGNAPAAAGCPPLRAVRGDLWLRRCTGCMRSVVQLGAVFAGVWQLCEGRCVTVACVQIWRPTTFMRHMTASAPGIVDFLAILEVLRSRQKPQEQVLDLAATYVQTAVTPRTMNAIAEGHMDVRPHPPPCTACGSCHSIRSHLHSVPHGAPRCSPRGCEAAWLTNAIAPPAAALASHGRRCRLAGALCVTVGGHAGGGVAIEPAGPEPTGCCRCAGPGGPCRRLWGIWSSARRLPAEPRRRAQRGPGG